MSERFRIRVALLDARKTLCAVELAEVALGLSCIIVCKDTGRWKFAGGEKDRLNSEFEYFGREDIDDHAALPVDYRELAEYKPGLWVLADITSKAIVKYVDFWFSEQDSRLLR